MTRRRKRILIVAAVVFLGLIVVQSTMFIRPRRQITIEVEGTPGASIVASFDVDGTLQNESRDLPTDFSFHARYVSFSMIPEAGPSENYVAVKAHLDDKHILSCRDRNGVRGNVTAPSLLGLGSNNSGIGGIRPGEFVDHP